MNHGGIYPEIALQIRPGLLNKVKNPKNTLGDVTLCWKMTQCQMWRRQRRQIPGRLLIKSRMGFGHPLSGVFQFYGFVVIFIRAVVLRKGLKRRKWVGLDVSFVAGDGRILWIGASRMLPRRVLWSKVVLGKYFWIRDLKIAWTRWMLAKKWLEMEPVNVSFSFLKRMWTAVNIVNVHGSLLSRSIRC